MRGLGKPERMGGGERMREVLISRIVSLLRQKGCEVSTFLHTNSCFDIAAGKPGIKLLVKVFDNIDSMRPEQAEELKRISSAFNSVAVVVGRKSKSFVLKEGVFYERFEIPVLSLASFSEFLDSGLPAVKFFNGRLSAEMDFEKLRQSRKKEKLSLSELAQKVYSTKESLHRYEQGKNAQLETARRLEEVLSCSLIRNVGLKDLKPFSGKPEAEERKSDELFDYVRGLGVKVEVFEHAPFNALSGKGSELLMSRGKGYSELIPKAISLRDASKVFSKPSVIFSRSSARKNISGIPIVLDQELYSMSKFRELLEAVKKREIGKESGSAKNEGK